jgi:hypothetical protein
MQPAREEVGGLGARGGQSPSDAPIKSQLGISIATASRHQRPMDILLVAGLFECLPLLLSRWCQVQVSCQLSPQASQRGQKSPLWKCPQLPHLLYSISILALPLDVSHED